MINLLIGFLVLPGFGESIDELPERTYAKENLQAIQSLLNGGGVQFETTCTKLQLQTHGGAFGISLAFLRRLLVNQGNAEEKLYFDHFVYFIIFQIGVVSIFFLARRWVSDAAALGTAILFNTQPLLAGHAFINPKDAIFMSLVSASAALGLWAIDSSGSASPANKNPIKEWGRLFGRAFLSSDVWLAGFVLGFACAVRVGALLVAGLVIAQVLITRRWHILPRLAAYGLIAFGVMVMFWPYLWSNPVVNLWQAALGSIGYTDYHVTLFKGALFDSRALPRSYLPVLLTIQLTEPVLLLALLGIFAFLRQPRTDFFVLALIWFLLPAGMVILGKVALYNNFRQVLFILPPLFFLAGRGLEWLFLFIKRPSTRTFLLVLAVLPGLWANFDLYPYQYVYYNQLAGGLPGAYRVYELDYWNTAFREAQLYVNEHASPGADIYVNNSKYVAQTFARPDLSFNTFGEKDKQQYAYLIISTAQNADEKFDQFPTVFLIERDGVPLAYVKKP